MYMIVCVYIYIQLKTYTCNVWSYESLAHPNHQRLEVKREVVPPLVRIHGHPGFMVNSKCLFLWGYHKRFCGLQLAYKWSRVFFTVVLNIALRVRPMTKTGKPHKIPIDRGWESLGSTVAAMETFQTHVARSVDGKAWQGRRFGHVSLPTGTWRGVWMVILGTKTLFYTM